MKGPHEEVEMGFSSTFPSGRRNVSCLSVSLFAKGRIESACSVLSALYTRLVSGSCDFAVCGIKISAGTKVPFRFSFEEKNFTVQYYRATG